MLNKIIAESLIQQAKKLVEKHDHIVIVSHISPDGDALGSSLGLYHFLTQLGKTVNVLMPNDFPDFLRWLKSANDVTIADRNPELAKEVVDSAELIFCLDFNTLKRVGDLGSLIQQASAKKILIDHHPQPDDFCDVTISYPEISSTSELIFRFICRMEMYGYVNKSCAESIYTGMMTDTGAFSFNSSDPHIFFIISELLQKGINKDQIYSNVYNTYSADRVRLMGFTFYQRMKIYPEYQTALIYLTQEDAKQFHLQKGDTEGFVNIPLSIKDVVFSVFIREDKDLVKISLRSKGDFPTNQLASEVFHGGGHLNASGGEFYGKLEDAIALFEQALPRYKDLLNNTKP